MKKNTTNQLPETMEKEHFFNKRFSKRAAESEIRKDTTCDSLSKLSHYLTEDYPNELNLDLHQVVLGVILLQRNMMQQHDSYSPSRLFSRLQHSISDKDLRINKKDQNLWLLEFEKCLHSLSEEFLAGRNLNKGKLIQHVQRLTDTYSLGDEESIVALSVF